MRSTKMVNEGRPRPVLPDTEVTVIIPVRNDARNLGLLLESLDRQTYQEFEILIIDDSSTDSTPVVARKHSFKDPRSRCIFLSKRLTKGKVRRLGGVKARTEFLAFTDSDCVVEDNWLDKLLEPLKKGECDVSFGPDYIDRTGTLWSKAKADSVRPYRRPDTRNMAIRRDVLMRIGNFDERFGNVDPAKPLYGSDEAAELGLRIARHQINCKETDAVVFHAFPPTLMANLRKAAQFGRGAFHIHRFKSGLPPDTAHVLPRFLRHVRVSLKILREPISADRKILAIGFRLLFFYIYFISLLKEWKSWVRSRNALNRSPSGTSSKHEYLTLVRKSNY